jgi:Tfp pilus assembly protein PilX
VKVILRFIFKHSSVANNRGFALVTVLVFAAVLMATLALVMNSTLMETFMSGAGTVSKRALAVADAGVEYVRGTFVLIGNSFPASASSTGGNYTTAAQTNLPAPSNNQITFLNLSSMGVDNTLLSNSGFSGKYVSPNSGGGALSLSAYRSRTTSRAQLNLYGKTVEFEGFNLAP